MNSGVGPAQIGEWYARSDKGEVFQVVGRDERARSIEIQLFDGDLDEIDEDTWSTLPLERCAAPEDWTGPVDEVEPDDMGYSETAMRPADWTAPLQPLRGGSESAEEVVSGEDIAAPEETAADEDNEAPDEGAR